MHEEGILTMLKVVILTILNARRRHLNNAESHLEMGNLDATVQDLKMYFLNMRLPIS